MELVAYRIVSRLSQPLTFYVLMTVLNTHLAEHRNCCSGSEPLLPLIVTTALQDLGL